MMRLIIAAPDEATLSRRNPYFLHIDPRLGWAALTLLSRRQLSTRGHWCAHLPAMMRLPTEATTRKVPRGRGAKWLGSERGILKSILFFGEFHTPLIYFFSLPER